jgi:hypothetical protein
MKTVRGEDDIPRAAHYRWERRAAGEDFPAGAVVDGTGALRARAVPKERPRELASLS